LNRSRNRSNELLAERAHTVECAYGRNKIILLCGHGFSRVDDSLLLVIQDEVDDLSVGAVSFGGLALPNLTVLSLRSLNLDSAECPSFY